MPLVDDALALAAQGLPVFPCNDLKRPVTAHGFKDATTDPEEVRRLFALPGAALIGVPSGMPTRCVVLDCDAGRGGMEWLDANRHRLPATREHATRSGGRHLLFAYPDGDLKIGNRTNIFPGVDIRAEGGYIIAPPSPGYGVVAEAAMQPCPDWLVAAISRQHRDPPPQPDRPRQQHDHPDGTRYGMAALDDECQAIMRAPFGAQETTLNAAALKIGALVAGGQVLFSAARSALLAAARHMANEPGKDPWHPAEIERKIERGLADGARRPRSPPDRERPRQRTENGAERDEGPAGGEGAENPEGAQDAPQGEPLPLLPPILEDETQIPERRWVGGVGAFPRGRLAAVAGPPGVNKTTFALQCSIALACGVGFGGIIQEGPPQRVLMGIIEDDIEEIWRRCHAATLAMADAPHLRALIRANFAIIDLADQVPLFEVMPDGRLTQTQGAKRLLDTIEAFRPDLVFLDPLIELHTAEEGSNTLMRPVNRALRKMAVDNDCAVAALHHETKAGEGTALQRLRGAGGIGGAIRFLISLRPMTEKEAEENNIDAETADLFVKAETGKAQYARKARPRWFEIEERDLANGDRAHLLVPWTPAKSTIDAAMLHAAEIALRAGHAGEPCSESNNATACYRRAFDLAGIPRHAQADVLFQLKQLKRVELRKWRDQHARKTFARIYIEGTPHDGWI